MDRIRGLVVEERCLQRDGRRDLAAAVRLEINALQEQLAALVRGELSHST